MSKISFIQFFYLYVILRCFGMFPYCIHKSKLRIKFIQRRKDIVLNIILIFFYLCCFSWLLPQCIESKGFLRVGEKLHVYINAVLLYLNCYRFLGLFIKVLEDLQYFDIKIRCPRLKNKLFLIYISWKSLIYVLYIIQDIIFYILDEGSGDKLRCIFFLYLYDVLQTNQEALYIFALSLIRDRVVILEAKINEINNIDVRNLKIFTYALSELKNNFQSINRYFSLPLLIKLTSNFVNFLVSVNIVLVYKKEGNLSIFGAFMSCGWFIVLCLDTLLSFYCVDKSLVAVSLTNNS